MKAENTENKTSATQVRKVKGKIPWVTLIASLFVLAGGILLISMSDILAEMLLILAVAAMLVIFGVVVLVQGLKEKKVIMGSLLFTLCWVGATVLIVADYRLDIAALVPNVIVGAVSILLGVIRALICVNCFINHFQGGVRNGISAVLCLGFGLVLVIFPFNNLSVLTFVAGFYMIFYAITMFIDGIAAVFHADMGENRRRRRVHFALPNLITAIKPSRTINMINRELEKGELKSGVVIEEKPQKQFDHINLEVMVHLTTQGLNKFGHVDIAIGDTVYSYGTYDSSTVKYGGFVSQGSFIKVPKVSYLHWCLDYQKKYVIGFGACLSEKQLKNVQDRIDGFVSEQCEPLESPYEAALRTDSDGSELKDTASNIVRDVGGKVWTVVRGPYRRYFGININCVQFADWLLGDSGIDAVSFSGLRTPGAYYSMLDNMFRRKNTRVIRRTWYVLSKDIN